MASVAMVTTKQKFNEVVSNQAWLYIHVHGMNVVIFSLKNDRESIRFKNGSVVL